MKCKFSIAIIFIALISCNDQKVDTAKESEELMQLSREWSEAASGRDIEKTLSYWDDNAMVISAGEAPLKGKEAIRGMLEGSMKNPDFNISWKPQMAKVSESGDMAYLIENTTINVKDSAGNPVTQHFKVVTIWEKKADGSWKNVVDVMSPDPSQK